MKTYIDILSYEPFASYLIPGTLVLGGMAFCAGYYFGSKAKLRPDDAPKKEGYEIHCYPPSREMSRVSSLQSMSSYPDSGSDCGTSGDQYRLALIVRKDCGLSRGKTIIHCCRAFLAQFKKLYKNRDDELKDWERDGMTIVVLRVQSVNELHSIKSRANDLNIASHTYTIKQTDGSSLKTVMALGPSKSSRIRELTHHLHRL